MAAASRFIIGSHLRIQPTFDDNDLCFTAIRSALNIVAEEPISNTTLVDELCSFHQEVSKLAVWDDPTTNAFLENPLACKNILVSHTMPST